MKKSILSLGLALLSVSPLFASDDNPYVGTADVPYVQLDNGILMPQFGLGTFLQPNDSVCYNSVSTALKAGYRHIDTAQMYMNEEGVGAGIRQSGVPGQDIFLVDKLWFSCYPYDKAKAQIDKSLRNSGQTTSTLCSYISHTPTCTGPTGPWRMPRRRVNSALSV